MASLQLTGIKDVIGELKALDKKLQKKVVKEALKAGAKVFLKEMKDKAPVDTGLMRRALSVRVKTHMKRGDVGYQVMFRKKDVEKLASTSKAGDRYFYPAAVEYGTSRADPHPFMRPAFDSKKEQAIATIRDVLRGAIALAGQKTTTNKVANFTGKGMKE